MFILTSTPNAYPKVSGFEGKVNILREGIYDTILVEVYIKGNHIRVNELYAIAQSKMENAN